MPKWTALATLSRLIESVAIVNTPGFLSLLVAQVKFEPEPSSSHESSSSQVKKIRFLTSFWFLLIAILSFIMLRQIMLKISTVQEIFFLSSDRESLFPVLVTTYWTKLTPFLAYPPHLLISLKGFDQVCWWPELKELTVHHAFGSLVICNFLADNLPSGM